MTCELWRDQIDAYVDGELPLDHEAEVAGHLRNCAGCNALAAETIQTKRAIAQAGRRYQPSSEFRAQIVRSIGARESHARSFWLQLVLAAALIVIVAAGVLALRGRASDLNRELADIHLNTIASANPVDVVSSDMHTVKPWFQGKLPFTFNVPELANSPFTLLGGRVVYVHGTPCAQLLFQYRLHRITTLIGAADVLGSGNREANLANGFHLVRSEHRGYAFVTMGDAAMDVVSDLSGRVQAAQ
jgi:anti-sigma factor RsiW